jgi:hypothetical protein
MVTNPWQDIRVSKNGRAAASPCGRYSHIDGLSPEERDLAFRGRAIIILTGCKPSRGRMGDSWRVVVRRHSALEPRVVRDRQERELCLRALRDAGHLVDQAAT